LLNSISSGDFLFDLKTIWLYLSRGTRTPDADFLVLSLFLLAATCQQLRRPKG